jgi:hypothetical protein
MGKVGGLEDGEVGGGRILNHEIHETHESQAKKIV